MKKKIFLTFCLLYFSSCGKLPDLKEVTANISSANNSQSTMSSSTYAGPYSPGAYFKILKQVDSGNDTRIYEFKYLADGSFTILQKCFPGGILANGYFHKTTGTYKEDAFGNISHTIIYDTCNDMTTKSVLFSGNVKDIVSIVIKGSALSFYSSVSWTIPKSISSEIVAVVEDVGCTKF